MISVRNHIPFLIRKKKDESIYKKVINNKIYRNANTVFIFVSYGSEVDTHKIINYMIKDGKRVCVPKIINLKDGIMKSIEISSMDELKLSFKGILEPEYDEKRVIDEIYIDLAIVPGVAFDKYGGRLGYGGGFYDRFLKKMRSNSEFIALCYEEQMVEEVPSYENDIKICHIIKE